MKEEPPGHYTAAFSPSRVRLYPIVDGSSGSARGTGRALKTTLERITPFSWYSECPSSSFTRSMTASGFLNFTSEPSSCVFPITSFGIPS